MKYTVTGIITKRCAKNTDALYILHQSVQDKGRMSSNRPSLAK